MSSESQLELDWIHTPVRDYLPYKNVSSQYGAARIAAKYCGLNTKTHNYTTSIWKHGWHPDFLLSTPERTVGEHVSDPENTPVYVARQAEAQILRNFGFRIARAIGLPIAYLPPPDYQRRPNSLLVMPVHSLDHSQHEWQFETYAKAISDVASAFDTVVACVHPSCVKHGYWIKEFQKLGIPFMEGASPNDFNSLERMRAIFAQFEYMTTNSLTSAIAYASAFGVKTSIFGPYSCVTPKDVEEVSFYQKKPGLAKRSLPLYSEENVRQHLSFLFCPPHEAKQLIEWGKTEIGEQNKLPPDELLDLLFPDSRTRNPKPFLASRAIDTVRKAGNTLKRNLRFRSLLNRITRTRENTRPLPSSKSPTASSNETYIPETVRTIKSYLFGNDQFDNARFELLIEDVFTNSRFDFPCIYDDPEIMLFGTLNGILISRYLDRFPNAVFTVFERHDSAIELVNCVFDDLIAGNRLSSFKFPSHQTTEHHQSPLGDERQLREDAIQFCAVDSEFFLPDCFHLTGNILNKIKRMRIEYNSCIGAPQRLGEIVALLEATGFRHHISPKHFSTSPFNRVTIHDNLDQSFTIWAYRGPRFPRTM